MTSSDVRLAWVAQLSGFALALAGLLPVLVFVCRALLPAAEASVLPVLLGEYSPAWASAAESWLQSRRIRFLSASAISGLAFALPGLLVMLLGALLAGRGRATLDAHRMRKEDARRRVQHYRGERVEPTLGAAD